MHRLLERQLKKFCGQAELPQSLQRFLQAISDAYTAADEDRELIERSMQLSSEELLERNGELMLAERKYRTILESAIDCIIAMSHDGRIIEFNPAAQRAFGYTREEAIGQNLAALLIPPPARAEHARGLARYLRTGEGPALDRRMEVIAMHKDGHEFPVELSITRINLSGPPTFSAYLRDITDRKQAEQDIRRAQEQLEARVQERTAELAKVNQSLRLQVIERERAEAEAKRSRQIAEAANQAKSEFLANMSHEIRTPMTAILGYTDMLLAGEQSPAQRLDCINTIRRESEHLLSVLSDILDISKIEAGKLHTERVVCSPAQIVNETVALMRVPAAEKGIKLAVTFAGPVPQTIQTDPTRMRQVLFNLIGNAIKFTHVGAVQVVVSLDYPAGHSQPKLRIEVIDSGIGISEQQLVRLFRPFMQADASTTRRFGGSGLGLAISKRLAQMLGGDIAVQSHLGYGSRFILTLEPGDLEGVRFTTDPPASEASSTAAPQAATSAPLPRIDARILLAEDGVHNQRVIAFYLQQVGAEVTIAENGRIACEKAAAAAQSNQPFDLILMDMQMPELDGYAATALLRAKGFALPIIALTAHAMSHDREKCLKAGCTDYLTKPIDKDVLIKCLALHLASPVAAKLSLSTPPPLRSSTSHEPEIAAFLSSFIHDLPEMVSTVLRLAAQSDLAGLQSALHQLRGTAGLYGFMPITDQASLAERQLNDTKAMDDIWGEIHALINLMRRVEGYDPGRETFLPQLDSR